MRERWQAVVVAAWEFAVEAGLDYGKSIKLRSEEAREGMKVRVRDDYHQPELRGRVGTVLQIWGHPSYVALDVQLDNGGSELFWHYQLEKEEH